MKHIGSVAYMGGIWAKPEEFDWSWTQMLCFNYEHLGPIHYDRARLTNSMHNGRWLLCWPPGFVRVTAPLSHDPQRWRITVEANRISGANASRPVERVWPGGYTTLLRPFGAPPIEVQAGMVHEKHEDLGLFADAEVA